MCYWLVFACVLAFLLAACEMVALEVLDNAIDWPLNVNVSLFELV